jgi:hypothetical protein
LKPENHGEIIAALQQARTDAPSDTDAKALLNRIKQAENEKSVSTLVLPEILKSGRFLSAESPYRLVPGASWSKDVPLPKLIPSKANMPSPEPDISMGLNADAAPKAGRIVSESLDPYFKPISCASKVWCPFFTVETKG